MRLHRNQFFRNDLGRIQQIEVESLLVLFFDNLHAEFPLGKVAVFDGFPQITPVEVGSRPEIF